MKLIEPKVELIKQEPGIEGIYKQIEVAARLCYKSEDKIIDVIKIDLSKIPDSINVNDLPNYKENKEECLKFLKENNIPYSFISSAKSFVNMLKERGHNAMLEHGTVYLRVKLSEDEITPCDSLYHYKNNKYSNYTVLSTSPNVREAFITTNYRVLVENGWLDDLKYLCEPTSYHQKRYTFHFVTSIGITRELIRHRHMSFANESTRYCNYNSGKFNGEITFIKPYWLKDVPFLDEDGHFNSDMYYFDISPYYKLFQQPYIDHSFLNACVDAEVRYKGLISNGFKPQEAREVLPMCTKSEIIMTGFESDWNAFFKLRCDKAAHPDMQYLANKAKEIIDNEKMRV